MSVSKKISDPSIKYCVECQTLYFIVDGKYCEFCGEQLSSIKRVLV